MASEPVALIKRQEAELKMSIYESRVRVTRMNKVKNEYIRGIAQLEQGSRLRWFGRVQRRLDGHIGQRTLNMETRRCDRRGC